jgi:hypothetical protein
MCLQTDSALSRPVTLRDLEGMQNALRGCIRRLESRISLKQHLQLTAICRAYGSLFAVA